jgi:hypothetical protein
MSAIHVSVDDPPSVSGEEFLRDDITPARFERSGRVTSGLVFARAFSERLEVVSTCRSKRGRIVCAHGDVIEPLVIEEVDLPDHLLVHMTVDPNIFSVVTVGIDRLASIVRDVANRRRVSVELVDSERGDPIRFLATGEG